MRSKLQKEAAKKFLVWALSQIEFERGLHPKNRKRLDELQEIKWGLDLLSTAAGIGKIFDQIKDKI